MAKFTNPLDGVRVAAPCPANWDAMSGDNRVRFCNQCNLNVYNLSDMTRSEAERLIAHSGNRLCVRYFRRADGTILTDNCPVGLRAVRRRLSRAATAIASLVFSFLGGLGVSGTFSAGNSTTEDGRGMTMGAVEMRRDARPSSSPSTTDAHRSWTMGDMSVPLAERER